MHYLYTVKNALSLLEGIVGLDFDTVPTRIALFNINKNLAVIICSQFNWEGGWGEDWITKNIWDPLDMELSLSPIA